MAEESPSLAQRVEALEQISQARVVERIGQIEQRVSRIESAREAEEPHLATKADVACLETLIVETRSDLMEQNLETRSDLQEQIAETRSVLQEQNLETRSDLLRQMVEYQSDLEEKINTFNTAGEKRLRHFLMWLIGTAIALAAVIIASFAIIVGPLP